MSLTLNNLTFQPTNEYHLNDISLHFEPGKMYTILGRTLSGKTTLLLSRLDRYEIGGKKCIVIKYNKDTRYDNDKISTHKMNKHEAISTDTLIKLNNYIKNYEIIYL